MKLLLVLTALVALATAEWKTYENYQQVEVVPRTEDQVGTLRSWMLTETDIDFWLEPGPLGAPVHILVPPRIRPVIYRRLNDLGLKIKVLDENVGATVEEERQRLANKPRAIDLDEFNTYDDIMDWIDEVAADCPTGLECDVSTPGTSYEGRAMKVLHIRNPNTVNPPVYWMDSAIHAREWLAPATLMKIIDHMVYQYGSDNEVTSMLNSHEFWFLPVMNPDGYVYTFTNDRMWRKNRAPNQGSGCVGTDLNRNYDWRWCMEGASTLPCSDSYCGSSGGSEDETKVVQAESARVAGSSNNRAWITFHAYGRMWMFPWGNTVNHAGNQCERADDHAEMQAVSTITSNAIRATYNTPWSDGTSCEVIYETTGATDDYVKGTDDWQHAICPELRGTGFVVPPSEIEPSFREIWNGIVAMTGEV